MNSCTNVQGIYDEKQGLWQELTNVETTQYGRFASHSEGENAHICGAKGLSLGDLPNTQNISR